MSERNADQSCQEGDEQLGIATDVFTRPLPEAAPLHQMPSKNAISEDKSTDDATDALADPGEATEATDTNAPRASADLLLKTDSAGDNPAVGKGGITDLVQEFDEDSADSEASNTLVERECSLRTIYT